MNWPLWPIQSLSRNVHRCVVSVSVSVPLVLRFFHCPITPIYKGQKSNLSITKIVLEFVSLYSKSISDTRLLPVLKVTTAPL